MSRNCRLTIEAADPLAEIMVYDGAFKRVGRDVGRYDGVSERALRGARPARRGDPGKADRARRGDDDQLDPVEFASSIPFTGEAADQAEHAAATAAAFAHPEKAGTGSGLLLCVRDRPRREPATTPLPASPAAGLRLFGGEGFAPVDGGRPRHPLSRRRGAARRAVPGGGPGRVSAAAGLARRMQPRTLPRRHRRLAHRMLHGQAADPRAAACRSRSGRGVDGADRASVYRGRGAAAAGRDRARGLGLEPADRGCGGPGAAAGEVHRSDARPARRPSAAPRQPARLDIGRSHRQCRPALGPDHPDARAIALGTPYEGGGRRSGRCRCWGELGTELSSTASIGRAWWRRSRRRPRFRRGCCHRRPGSSGNRPAPARAGSIPKLAALRSYIGQAAERLPEADAMVEFALPAEAPAPALDEEDRAELARSLGVPGSDLDDMLSKLGS